MRSLAGVSLMLRLLWASLRWDDMAVKPSTLVAMTRKGEKILINKINRFLAKFSASKANPRNAKPDDNSAIQHIPLYYQCSRTN